MSEVDRRVILLVYGQPGQGKSYLAEKLKAEHSFAVLSVDDTYVEFIKVHCPMLYFDALDYYVGPHHNHIIGDRVYSRAQLGRDFFAEWRAYLNECIASLAARHDRLVVEGAALQHYKDQMETEVASLAPVFQIEVADRSYRWQGQPVSLTQIAALGKHPSSSASIRR